VVQESRKDWRPEDWQNPHNPDDSGTHLPSDPDQIFEAGADAMLEALKAEGWYSTPAVAGTIANKYGSFKFNPTKPCWAVFIPGEE